MNKDKPTQRESKQFEHSATKYLNTINTHTLSLSLSHTHSLLYSNETVFKKVK